MSSDQIDEVFIAFIASYTVVSKIAYTDPIRNRLKHAVLAAGPVSDRKDAINLMKT